MQLNVNQTLLNQQPSVKALVGLLQENEHKLNLEDAIVHHNFPLYLDHESSITRPDIMVVSKNYGVLIFNCIESSKRTPYTLNNEILDNIVQIYSSIYAKLLKNKNLRKNPNQLRVQLKPILYCFGGACDFEKIKDEWDDLVVIEEDSKLTKSLKDVRLDVELEEDAFKIILSILEGSHGIRKRNERSLTELGDGTKGAILNEIENQIANFDTEQKRAAFRIIDGPQRIRGLAGSGKTIVLAMKAAMIHLQEPDSHILYTYYTKQLHGYIESLIRKFYRQYSDGEPDWKKIDIMHAWGGRNGKGVYYNTCIDNNIPPKSFGDVKGFGKEAFNTVCESLKDYKLKKSYDYSIIDEGQDFPKYFYRLCCRITKNKRVIWGYDDCQNILDIKIQDTVETFGKNASDEPYIDFSKKVIADQDLILYKCYRNPRTILVAAIALGFGIYSEKIIQLPEEMGQWKAFGFKILKGNYKQNDRMEIIREEKNSPLMKNKLLDETNTAIKWKVFLKEGVDGECQFVADSIIKDLQEGLLPEDIMVISLDDVNARDYFNKISSKLIAHDINTYDLLKQPSNNTVFMIEKHITLTTVYRAKGNEAGCVYIVGVDRIFRNKDSIQERNKLFTAITRANAWVTITGVGEGALKFEKEIQKIELNNYQLNFDMPDIHTLRTIQKNLAKRDAIYNEWIRQIEEKADELGIDKDILLKELNKRIENKGS